VPFVEWRLPLPMSVEKFAGLCGIVVGVSRKNTQLVVVLLPRLKHTVCHARRKRVVMAIGGSRLHGFA
jgi:hypothetical protein